MRHVFLAMVLLLNCLPGSTQTKALDSLRLSTFNQMPDTVRVNLYLLIADSFYSRGNPDSGLLYSHKGEELSKEIKWKTGEGKGHFKKLRYNLDKANFSEGLSVLFKSLEIFEKAKDTSNILNTLITIGIFYKLVEDFPSTVIYCQKAYHLSRINNNSYEMWRSTFNIGDAYFYLKLADSTLIYFQDAYQIMNRSAFNKDNETNAWTYIGLGRAAFLLHDLDFAKSYLYKSSTYADKVKSPFYEILYADLYETFSDIHTKANKWDSAIKYSKLSLAQASKTNEILGISITYKQLAVIYEHTNKDSSIKYYKLGYNLRDSIFNSRSKAELSSITHNEIERQKRVQEEQTKAAELRRRNIQYLAIAIGLVTMIILFLLYSRSIIGKEKVIKYLGVLVLLIVFEFINLYIHPFLAHATDESPLLMLLTMVAVAAILVPAHHRIEQWVRHQLIEKNKRIRLASAKKTINELEGS